LCALDPKIADKWQSGCEIQNAEVREKLAKHRKR